MAGEVELVVDATTYVLKAGDSFAFKSTLLHAFRNPGAERCQILWVNTTKRVRGARWRLMRSFACRRFRKFFRVALSVRTPSTSILRRANS
ncbi:cupin domain-containing protein [Mesorhizobium atlanticum]